MTRRAMPPGRVSREVIRRLLARNDLKPRHVDRRGKREGIFVWQHRDTLVRVSVDVDDGESRQALHQRVHDVLTEAGYALEDRSSADTPAWWVTQPVDQGSESVG